MGWNSIRIEPADRYFSEFIRRRDKKCVACGRPGEGGKGIIGLQCSHYYSRSNRNTRFDPENCDALCANCHRRWGGDYREEYIAFKKKQLGEACHSALIIRVHLYKKKDKIMELLTAKAYLKSL